MSPLRKVYLEELTRIQERLQELFDQSLLSAGYTAEGDQPGTWHPSIDLVETEDAFVLFAELPGIRREDIDLAVSDRRLELSGRRHLPGEGHNFLRMERSYGPFRRVFDLGVAVDAEGCTAGFDHGILKVHLPKQPAVVPGAPG
jgi:HSP20 family protein